VLEAEALRHVAVGIAVRSGVIGVGGLACGSALLVWETRMALAILVAETEFVGRVVVGKRLATDGPGITPSDRN
jgi:hypothetical protein